MEHPRASQPRIVLELKLHESRHCAAAGRCERGLAARGPGRGAARRVQHGALHRVGCRQVRGGAGRVGGGDRVNEEGVCEVGAVEGQPIEVEPREIEACEAAAARAPASARPPAQGGPPAWRGPGPT